MVNEDVIKEFIFDCKMRKLSDRTIKSYKNNNLAMFCFIKQEYGIVELEETNHIAIKGYIEYLTNNQPIQDFKRHLTISVFPKTYEVPLI